MAGVATASVTATLDEDESPHDVDDVELVDLRSPIRREVFARNSFHVGCPRHLSIAELRLAAMYLDCGDAGSYAPVARALVVGENPGPKTRHDMPLFPWPPSSSAGRLMGMSGLSGGQYLGGLYRRNLVDDRRWDRLTAERRARCIVTALFEMPRDLVVVLRGRKVTDAFDLRAEFWIPVKLASRQICVAIPHPSGLNHAYNDADARALTRAWMRHAVLGEELPK